MKLLLIDQNLRAKYATVSPKNKEEMFHINSSRGFSINILTLKINMARANGGFQ